MLRDYIGLARPDHWFKNVFMIPGMVLGWMACGRPPVGPLIPAFALAIASACLVASSNYTINEWLDADEDRQHPEKKFRPAGVGRILVSLAYVQWILWRLSGSHWAGWSASRSSGAPPRSSPWASSTTCGRCDRKTGPTSMPCRSP